MEQHNTKVVIMRAGTSKGIFIKDSDLPTDKKQRDKLILKIFGSPDVRQIDGLGGADPLTSKLAIIGPSSREDADVDYTFGQVSYTAPKIDYSGNCGNISAGVAPFAVDEGYVNAVKPVTTVRVHNTNTGKILVEKVEVDHGKAKVIGDFSIAGVPGTGAPIAIDFSDTQGSKTGKLLPTDNVVDKISVQNYGQVTASLVDAANPMVFVKAEDLNLKGTETPAEIDENKSLLKTLEEIRGKAATMMGLVDSWEKAVDEVPAFPMLALVSEAQNYKDFTKGTPIDQSEVDFVSRLMFMQVVHKTYAGTATICTGAAARVEGTVVNEVMKDKNRGRQDVLRIGHPAGVITIDVTASKAKEGWELNKAVINRTARRIMEGDCYTTKRG
ncbi:PrpF domain-containing protein [Proteinivorax hydrogeniformans]|uniref:PrpF domain-containing protein n=1 Tax=Proteinivorax hydrogeniformans TaxID=1826727 RepID=A0AAU8HUG5_9FIRM